MDRYIWIKIDSNLKELSWKIHYKTPDSIRFEVNEQFYGEFIFNVEDFSYKNPQLDMSIRQSSLLRIYSNTPCDWEEHHRIMQKVGDFICLGIGVPTAVALKEIKFAIPTTEPNGMWCDVFWRGKNVEAETPNSWEMLFAYKDIYQRLDHMVKSWISNTSSTRSIFTEYFSVIRSPSIYAEHRLVSFFRL